MSERLEDVGGMESHSRVETLSDQTSAVLMVCDFVVAKGGQNHRHPFLDIIIYEYSSAFPWFYDSVT